MIAADLGPTPVEGTRFESFRLSSPVVNAAGDVAFNWSLGGDVAGDATWLLRDGTLELLAGPDVPERLIDFAPMLPGHRAHEIAVGETQVVLYAGSADGREGLWRLDFVEASARPIAILGEASPAGDVYTAIDPVWDANGIGVVAFIGSTDAADHLIVDNGSAATVMMSTGERAPGTTDDTLAQFTNVIINEGNDVAVLARMGSGTQGLWVNRTGAVEVVAVPNGSTAAGEYESVAWPLALSDEGTLAYWATTYVDTEEEVFTALHLDPQMGSHSTPLSRDQPIAGVEITELNEVMFTAGDDFVVRTLVNIDDPKDAILSSRGGNLRLEALEGSMVEGSMLGRLEGLAANDQGRFAFHSTVGSASAVLWTDEDGDLSVLVKEGDEIMDPTGDLRIVGITQMVGGRAAFNRDGVLCPSLTLDGPTLAAIGCTAVTGSEVHQLALEDRSELSTWPADDEYDLLLRVNLTATTAVPTWRINGTFSEPVRYIDAWVQGFGEEMRLESVTCTPTRGSDDLATGITCTQDTLARPLGPDEAFELQVHAWVGPDGYEDRRLRIDWSAEGVADNGQPATAIPEAGELEVVVADFEVRFDRESPARLVLTNHGPDAAAPLLRLNVQPTTPLDCPPTEDGFDCRPGPLQPGEFIELEFAGDNVQAVVMDLPNHEADSTYKDPDRDNNEAVAGDITDADPGCASGCSSGQRGSGAPLFLVVLAALGATRPRPRRREPGA